MEKPLNWTELQILTNRVGEEICGQHVDKILIPKRPEAPAGFIKNEWVIRFRQGKDLVLRSSSKAPLFWSEQSRLPKHSTATKSQFDLALAKYLPGARLEKAYSLEGDRVVFFEFESSDFGKMSVVFRAIPARPELLLISGEKEAQGYPVLAHNRATSEIQLKYFDWSSIPKDKIKTFEPRDQFENDPIAFVKEFDSEVLDSLEEDRVEKIRRKIQKDIAQTEKKIASTQKTIQQVDKEPNWKTFGDILKTHLHSNPKPEKKGKKTIYSLEDFEGNLIEIEADPKLGPSEQADRYYQKEKRKGRKSEQANEELQEAIETKEKHEKKLASVVDNLNEEQIATLEIEVGIKEDQKPGSVRKKSWTGRIFLSKSSDLEIWVGKSVNENLDLTFKYANGNDVWLHVRGKPGAHVVIPLPAKKTAPLDTLIEASLLAVYFSGGAEWGKTDVDYTYRKNVKKIKGSKEVRYTGNKTLSVDPSSEELQTILGRKK